MNMTPGNMRERSGASNRPQIAEFQAAMAAFAAGITVVTTHDAGVPAGLIATSVCSLSMQPPSLLVCINKQAAAHDTVRRAGIFAVNLLSATQRDVARRFMTHQGPSRFAPDAWTSLATGAPVLRGATAVFDCELVGEHDGYSHTIFIGAIRQTHLDDIDAPGCLLWHQRDFACIEALAR